MKKVCLVYRKPVKDFFSIEKVFSSVKKGLVNKFEISELTVPHNGASIKSIVNNLCHASRHRSDIYHITGDIHYIALAFPGKKTILTIHDCVFLYTSRGFKRTLLKHLFLKWPVNHSSLITTISQATKNDIVKFSGCKPDKVLVIPNPLPEHIRFENRNFKKDLPVLLFIGTTQNKNLKRVISSVKNLRCILNIIGMIPAEIKTLLDQEGINWRNSFHLDENQLAEKYIEADIVLFPSLFEGFGLPIVEAQRAGRPVITSNLHPMKDVAGEGACLVDPENIDSIRSGILKVIENEDYRLNLISKGLQNVKRFQPETIIEQYISAYHRVLGN